MITLEITDQIDLIYDEIEKLIPRKYLQKCSEWAEENRYLSSGVSGIPGYFSFTNAPFAKEICDCFSVNSDVQEIAVMKAAQVGFSTSVIENAIAYTIDTNPCPMMFVFPNEQESKSYKKTRVDDLIDNSGLRGKIVAITDNRNTRRTGDTSELVEFQGGFLKLASANKGAQLRSASIKLLFLDEIDGYPILIKNEGPPIDIAVKRTRSFTHLGRKIIYQSTPTMAHNSRVLYYYNMGDKRKYLVPCPHCGKLQELVFYKQDGGEYADEKAIIRDGKKTKPFGLIFDSAECINGDYKSVRYRCKHCGADIPDYFKREMLAKGKWTPTETPKKPHFRSYHISALYSPSVNWWEIVAEFLAIGKDPQKLQTFYNLTLGLPFEEREGSLEIETVRRLKDPLAENNKLPEDALFLTMAADVQDNRIECEIKAWGDRFRCWGLDHRVFYGNPKNRFDDCWKKLFAVKDETFGKRRKTVGVGFIDSGDGENKDLIYSLCHEFGDGIVLPSKGFPATIRAQNKFKVVEIPDPNYMGLSLVEIFVDFYKNQLATYLKQEERVDMTYPDGWFSFARDYSDEYFRQLTTEKRVKKATPSGLTKIVWEQHGRNEAWDLNIYNLCAAEYVLEQYANLYKLLDQPYSVIWSLLKELEK